MLQGKAVRCHAFMLWGTKVLCDSRWKVLWNTKQIRHEWQRFNLRRCHTKGTGSSRCFWGTTGRHTFLPAATSQIPDLHLQIQLLAAWAPLRANPNSGQPTVMGLSGNCLLGAQPKHSLPSRTKSTAGRLQQGVGCSAKHFKELMCFCTALPEQSTSSTALWAALPWSDRFWSSFPCSSLPFYSVLYFFRKMCWAPHISKQNKAA